VSQREFLKAVKNALQLTELVVLDQENSYAYPKAKEKELLVDCSKAKNNNVIALNRPQGYIPFDFESSVTHKETDLQKIKVELTNILPFVSKFVNFLSFKGIPCIPSLSGRGFKVVVLARNSKNDQALFDYLVKDFFDYLKIPFREDPQNYFLAENIVIDKAIMNRTGQSLVRTIGSKHPEIPHYETLLTKREIEFTENPSKVVYPEELKAFEFKEKAPIKQEIKEPEKIELLGKNCLENILLNSDARNNDRLSAVLIARNGLKWDLNQTIEFFKNNKWKNYSAEKTEKHIKKLYFKDNVNPPKFKSIQKYCVHCNTCFYSKHEKIETKEKGFKGITVFRKPTEVVVDKELYSHINQRNIDGTEHFDAVYKIYTLNIGAGNNKQFLVIQPSQKVILGDAILFLEPLQVKGKPKYYKMEFLGDHQPQKAICQKICLMQFIPISFKKVLFNRSELIQKIAEKQLVSPFFFKLSSGCKEEEILKLSNNKLNEFAEDYTTFGFDVDARLTKIFKGDLLEPNPKLIQPADYMKFNPHSIIVTSTKTGKTSVAQRMGKVFEQPRIANLVGFATSNEVIRGSLDNLTEAVCFDEVMEEKDESTLSKMNSLMEQGIIEIAKGKKLIRTKNWSSFKFLGNPRPEKEDGELEGQTIMQEFQEEKMTLYLSDFLKKISHNSRALGSRIGVIMFDPKMPAITETKGITLKEKERLQSLIQTIKELSKDNYTKLYFDQKVNDWLNQKFDKDYLEAISKIKEDISLHSVSEFVKGHEDAFRHLNGLALKLSALDYLKDLMNGIINTKKLLERADKRREELQSINLNSFRQMGKEISGALLQRHYTAGLRNEYIHIQVLVNAIIEWNKKQGKTEEAMITENELTEHIKMQSLFKQEKFSVAMIWERLYKNFTKTNGVLTNYNLELNVYKEGDMRVVLVHKWHILNLIERGLADSADRTD